MNMHMVIIKRKWWSILNLKNFFRGEGTGGENIIASILRYSNDTIKRSGLNYLRERESTKHINKSILLYTNPIAIDRHNLKLNYWTMSLSTATGDNLEKNLLHIRLESSLYPQTSLGVIHKFKAKLLRRLSAIHRSFESHPLRATLHRGVVVYRQYRKFCVIDKCFLGHSRQMPMVTCSRLKL